MTSMDRAVSADDRIGLLDKERIIAPLNYNRWLVPPAALAIHLCIGMAYGFSVFWLPLGRAVGMAEGLGKPLVRFSRLLRTLSTPSRLPPQQRGASKEPRGRETS